ncbi:MAG: hypothetical protein ABJH28_10240 [Paraglaciecola sp.]|uniref:hypothetical protein n=1 Tax=Paraglaciecola sp. TaxID=1920173 RepID=UPI003263BE89
MRKLLTLLVYIATVSSVSASDIALVISPYHSPDNGKVIFKTAYNVFKGLELGDTLIVYNGNDASIVATLDVPNRPAFEYEKVRAKANKAELGKLKSFTSSLNQGKRTLGAMDTPRVLADIARFQPNVSDIMLMGSALYDNPHHKQMDMTQSGVPSDGVVSASAASSVFGTKGRHYLRGKRIHWVLPEPLNNSLHHEAVMRFSHVYIHALGGDLVSFTTNHTAVTQLLLNKATPLDFIYTLDKSGVLEMRIIQEASVNTRTEPQNIQRVNVQTTAPVATSYPVTLGIEWEGEGVDLDIYAQPQGGQVLYFGQTQSKQGVHVKDQRTGNNNSTRFYERIDLKPVDINTLKVAINIYDAPPSESELRGILRINYQRQSYQTPFTFKLAHGGNRGADINQTLSIGSDTQFSQLFNVREIMNTAVNKVEH